MKFKYCPLCGEKLELKNSWDEGMIPYCSKHDMMFFDLPKPCIVVAVIKGDGIGPEIVTEAMKVLDAIADKYNHKFN